METDVHDRVIGFSYHDGTLRGVEIEDGAVVRLAIRSSAGAPRRARCQTMRIALFT
jgi:hypothetical protein